MKSKTTTYIIIASLLVLFIGGSAILYNSLSDKYKPDEIVGPEDGAEKIEAVDFSILDRDGNTVNLSDYYGKPIVLNFWASWCPPCKAEFPHFEDAYNELGGDVTFLMVDLTDGQRETVEKAKGFIEDNGYTLPIYFDTTQEAAYIYGISSIPSTLFIDKDGYIRSGYRGAMDKKTLDAYIDSVR